MEGYTMAMAGNYGYFVIMIVIAVLGWVVQHNLKKKFEKYSQEYIPYTGAQVAQMMRGRPADRPLQSDRQDAQPE